ncbi:signal peptidase complex subunit 1 [Nematocida sp. AWRm77]|nr:signal peptidase complex subunit 1 [Nematocida sp. AWRm77]
MNNFKSLGEKLNPQIDYVGQELAKKILHSIYIVGFPLALIVGMYTSNIWYIGYSLVCVICIALLCVVPGWSIYRRNPVSFGAKKTQ